MRDQAAETSLRVLLVDDWPDAAEAMAALMRLWGHDTRIAHDGAAALDMATRYRPHVIFLDVGLPGIDGYQVARRLRANPSLHETFIVSITGCADAEAQRLSREAGCDGHLTKPVDPAGLERLLATRREIQHNQGDDAGMSPPHHESATPSSPAAMDSEMMAAAESHLRRHPYLALRNISCECHHGQLTLRGCLPSYYLKQIAQTVVAKIDGIAGIRNEIKVVGSSCCYAD